MLSPDALQTAVILAVLAWFVWSRGVPAIGPLARLCAGVWPDAWRLRRRWLPRLERLAPGVKFVLPVRQSELVGHYDVPPRRLRQWLRQREDVYPNNLAAAKYHDRADGRRFCVGSYAWRPEGPFSRWQTHIRLVEDGDGTLVVAHYEVSALAGVGEGVGAILREARRHYSGATLDNAEGVARARRLLADLRQ